MNNTIICLYVMNSVSSRLAAFIYYFTDLQFFFILPYHNITSIFVVLLPLGDYLIKLFPDPFDFEKIGSIAANIIAERTKANGSSTGHVSYYISISKLFGFTHLHVVSRIIMNCTKLKV